MALQGAIEYPLEWNSPALNHRRANIGSERIGEQQMQVGVAVLSGASDEMLTDATRLKPDALVINGFVPG